MCKKILLFVLYSDGSGFLALGIQIVKLVIKLKICFINFHLNASSQKPSQIVIIAT